MESFVNNYALALFSISEEKGNLLSIQEEMKSLLTLLNENKEITEVINSSFIKKEETISLISSIFSSFDQDIVSLIKILCNNHRFSYLEDVIKAFNSLVNIKRGILEGIVYSPFILKEKEINRIEEKISKLENKKVELHFKVDPHLIGGVKVVINGHIYDGTIKNKLQSIAKVIQK